MAEAIAVEKVKWYTLARRFPQLIGRTPDGARIPGGPYTVTQAVGGMAVLAVGYYSMGLWASFGTFGNYAVLILVTAAPIIGLGKIPLGARNPVSIAMGAARAASAPRAGRLRGKAVRIRAPHQVRHRIVLCRLIPTHADDLTPTPAPAAPVAPRPVSPPSVIPERPTPARPATAARRRPARTAQTSSPSPQLTGVQALMATVGAPTPKDD
jgi:hypothetical protein